MDRTDETQPEFFEPLGLAVERVKEKLTVRSQTESDDNEEDNRDRDLHGDRDQDALPFVLVQREAVEETWTAIRSTPMATREEFKGWIGSRPARRLPLRADMKPGGKRRD